jgi:hypothetical protein
MMCVLAERATIRSLTDSTLTYGMHLPVARGSLLYPLRVAYVPATGR